MRTLLPLLAAAVALTGCLGHTQVTEARLDNQGRFTMVRVDQNFAYLIDPRTESCFLAAAGADNFALVPVPCDKLKQNVPEAAAHIPWVPAPVASTP